MIWRSKVFVACIGSLLIGLPMQSPYLRTWAGEIEANNSPQQQFNQLSQQHLHQLAESITVKVLSGESWGSGVLIRRQGQVYTVLTNAHVLPQGHTESYQIQTSDGQIHSADLVGEVRLNNYDLAWVSFRSAKSYPLAELNASPSLKRGEPVFAAGFPYDPELSGKQGFAFTEGVISLFSDKAFAGGYRLGYTNDIPRGMSGGPLLNRQGQVIGINGIHAYPLWGNPYIFSDGSVASKAMQEKMRQLSWGIPAQTFVQLDPKSLPPSTNSPANPVPFSSGKEQSFPADSPLMVRPSQPTPQSKPRLW